MLFFELSLHTIEVGGKAVKTPGRGFVLTRFLLPFHRLEKEESVRLEDRKLSIQLENLFPLPQEYEVIRSARYGRNIHNPGLRSPGLERTKESRPHENDIQGSILRSDGIEPAFRNSPQQYHMIPKKGTNRNLASGSTTGYRQTPSPHEQAL